MQYSLLTDDTDSVFPGTLVVHNRGRPDLRDRSLHLLFQAGSLPRRLIQSTGRRSSIYRPGLLTLASRHFPSERAVCQTLSISESAKDNIGEHNTGDEKKACAQATALRRA